MSQPFIGEIRLVGFNFAPSGWGLCDGSLLPISQYEALFNLIGTTYGGDGQSTFALPDLRSRVPMHAGNGFVIGESFGQEAVSINGESMPRHNHAVQTSGTATSNSPASHVPAVAAQSMYAVANTSAMGTGSLTATGGSQPHNNIQPYLAMNYAISFFGVFPTQN